MTDTNKLPSKLKEYRKKNNFSQLYVAEQLNLSRQAISNWELGKTTPNIEDLKLLSNLYKVSLDELLNTEYPKNSTNSFDATIFQSYISTLEIIGITVILVLFSQVPIISIFVPALVFIWLRKTSRKYIVPYILCAISLIIGIYNSFIFIIHFVPGHGTPVIQQISGL